MSIPTLLVPGTRFTGPTAFHDALASVSAFQKWPPGVVVIDGAVFFLDPPDQLQFVGFAGPYLDRIAGWREPEVIRDENGKPVAIVDRWSAVRQADYEKQITEWEEANADCLEVIP